MEGGDTEVDRAWLLFGKLNRKAEPQRRRSKAVHRCKCAKFLHRIHEAYLAGACRVGCSHRRSPWAGKNQSTMVRGGPF